MSLTALGVGGVALDNYTSLFVGLISFKYQLLSSNFCQRGNTRKRHVDDETNAYIIVTFLDKMGMENLSPLQNARYGSVYK